MAMASHYWTRLSNGNKIQMATLEVVNKKAKPVIKRQSIFIHVINIFCACF